MHTDVCIDMRVDMRTDIFVDMGVCNFIRVDMCASMLSVCRHGYRYTTSIPKLR